MLDRTVELLSGATVFCKYRHGKKGLPILCLLHGFPQNHMMWDSFIRHLPLDWPLLVPDLPGYGNSAKDISPNDASAHSKSSWAIDILELADAIFPADSRIGEPIEHAKLIVFGHDRGARLAYRMALNIPERIVGLAVLDIVPTSFVWDNMNISANLHAETRGSHHWIFLSSPRPIPERLIASDPEFYFGALISAWTGPTHRDPQAKWVRDSLNPFVDNDKERVMARIVAACEDYRAGATIDVKDDLVAGIVPPSLNKLYEPKIVFNIPTLVMSSEHLRRRFAVDDIWASLCVPEKCTAHAIGDKNIGHFFVNEAPEETLRCTLDWLNKWWEY